MSGSEGGVYFLSRSELLAWVNNLLQLSYTKVEECCSGPRNRTQHTATGPPPPPPPPPRLCKATPLHACSLQPCPLSTGAAHCQIMDAVYPGEAPPNPGATASTRKHAC